MSREYLSALTLDHGTIRLCYHHIRFCATLRIDKQLLRFSRCFTPSSWRQALAACLEWIKETLQERSPEVSIDEEFGVLTEMLEKGIDEIVMRMPGATK